MKNEQDWAITLARTASQKVGIYPGDRYHARDHDKFVYVIARLLRRAERRGWRRRQKYDENVRMERVRP